MHILEHLPFSRLDINFAHFLSQRAKNLSTEQQQYVEKILMRLSYELHQGHNCLHINKQDVELLFTAELADTLGQRPLVIEKNRLYLQRYWHYEQCLANNIIAMLHQDTETLVTAPIAPLLERYFPSQPEESSLIDWQRIAAELALKQRFSIITGGPGTGKTTTVVKILALLQELHLTTPLAIALAAPTGKAALRLQQSIGINKSHLPCSEEIKKQIPEAVMTLHRLLGAKQHSAQFFHHVEHPLIYDVVVIDEASMIDLALMSKLVAALKPKTKLILLGDKDQLASVEAGAVLANLTTGLPAYSQELKTTYRFAGAIKTLADAVNAQQAEQAWSVLAQADEHCRLFTGDLISYIATQHARYLSLIKQNKPFEEIYSAYSQFQVLCANRHGEHSVAFINEACEQKLLEQKQIYYAGTWYSGRPIMIMENHSALGLYNGDIGICMPDQGKKGQLMVFFSSADGTIKKYLPARMPRVESAFAMTIHKSQGSEFDEVLIVLPTTLNPILTKELLYTAITRAKHTVQIVADHAIFDKTVQQKIERVTGLIDKLHASRHS
ncbi:MAG: exodeoxyribonuclease V subunit alpha [Methylococcaceae bacterium]|nr:MAG: exodeoxyribonuclease V subunit alpha [Methylococcaceae bacterium]